MNLVQANPFGHIARMAASSPSRPSPEDLKGKARIIARELLALGGPEHVKAREVAKLVGVSVGTIYNLFGDLDDLLFEVGGQVYDELHATVKTAAQNSRAQGDDLMAQLRALGTAYLNFVADQQDVWAGVLAFNRKSKDQVPDWYRDKERNLFEVLRTTLSPLLIDTPEADIAPQALWAAVHGIISVSVGGNGLLATRDEIAAQIDLIVRAVVQTLEKESRNA